MTQADGLVTPTEIQPAAWNQPIKFEDPKKCESWLVYRECQVGMDTVGITIGSLYILSNIPQDYQLFHLFHLFHLLLPLLLQTPRGGSWVAKVVWFVRHRLLHLDATPISTHEPWRFPANKFYTINLSFPFHHFSFSLPLFSCYEFL